ncbi:GNAT family N-acetyltransferase [Mumia zhuanghuii]|uniref:GNAT family N-acetyltransferase n=2 Tax=Mumia TaxID=1546255 RepID=A0ABW1QK71_9ACTN|nr:bifunctional GNAT family N-acetyltransferase/acetate--CoA ligase family protein [Mumia zhuanghuii]KAA1423377.1 GNAT family N-acetyltransferase [Mumia zhuanghuii]
MADEPARSSEHQPDQHQPDQRQPDERYPEHWEADVVLRDGGAAHLRPIIPDDAEELVAFYSRVSEQSKYYRFFAPYPTLSNRDVKRFTEVDYRSRVAFVVTIGASILAVGRYDAVAPGEAEVAFLVEDDQQGRGLAQLLLEHLAQAGREMGIHRFVADVLPENVRMIQVFRDQGYQVERSVEDGVMRLVFPIDPTETAIGVMQSREHRAEAASIERFFNARSVAVVGASRRQDTIGQGMIRNLVLGDFAGAVYAVNPQAEAVSGLPAYKTVQDIPGDVDLAVIAVPAESVPEVVLDCAAKGVHGLIVISSGFAEIGDEGRRRQRRLVGLARSYGLRLVGPNCLGVINTSSQVRLNASLSPLIPPRGRVGFFCQSGALGLAILENVDRRGLGLSTFVSAGNRADVSGNDLLQYWEEDDATEVVLLYLESIGNPRKFSRIARRVGRKKPVVAVKSGRSTQGVPVGHAVRKTTAPQSAVDAMFHQAGVIQVDTLDEMFDVAQLLAHQPLPRGPRVAVVGNSDALALLVADAATASGLKVADPVALGANASADDFEKALDAAIDNPDVDAIVAVFIPPVNTTGEDVANVLAAVGEQSDKPIVSTFLGSEGVPELLRVPDVEGAAGRGSVPSYSAPESAVRALARVVSYAQWAGSEQGDIAHFDDIDRDAASSLVRTALARTPDGGWLTDADVHELLRLYGIDLWDWEPVPSLDAAIAAGEQLGWNVVLKATADTVRARPDLTHVWRNISDADDMTEAWAAMTDYIGPPERAMFVVQKMAPPGVPISIRTVEDPLFGPLLSFALSGAASDLLEDRAYRIPPVTDVDVAAMIRELKSAPLLFGYRGGPRADLDAVEDLLQRVAALKDDLPEVSELNLEPVLAGHDGYRVLKARARVAQPIDNRRDWYVRRLSSPVGLGDTMADA